MSCEQVCRIGKRDDTFLSLEKSMTSRPLQVADLPMLQRALDQDEYEHLEVPDFTMDSAYSVVYEDEIGTIGILRYTKEPENRLRLVTVWCDNTDKKRNADSVIQAIADTVRLAKQSLYKEIVFCTQSPSLARFCLDRLGFEKDKDEYVLHI
jgi:hypothetical protein